MLVLTPEEQVILQDGHERRHLAEEQDLVLGRVHLGKDAVQKLKLARGTVQVRPGRHYMYTRLSLPQWFIIHKKENLLTCSFVLHTQSSTRKLIIYYRILQVNFSKKKLGKH